MPSVPVTDPLPLSIEQLSALVVTTTRELVWGRKAVSHEISRWRAAALHIPNPQIRADALGVLSGKRGNTDGAALFWTLLRRRDPQLLRLLVAHELIWDYLDSVSEHGESAGKEHSRQLHLAIVESLDVDRPISDYYVHHRDGGDGGFLRLLVERCRAGCRLLPAYAVVRDIAVREAERGLVQGINHELVPARRDARLLRWVRREYPHVHDVHWFELTGAASASLVVHVMLTLAADPAATERDALEAYDAYFPWVSLATVMLDSYVDQAEDAASGNHSYIAHYTSHEAAMERLLTTIVRAADGVLGLRNGHRHAVIFACMIAMYLSKDSARTPEMEASTRSLALAGGSLTQLLVPILRIWRIRYSQQSS
jgi:tetraprenyl-beta-curcumene synthase